MTLTTLLIANRGHLARRIQRTARLMGLRTVAVYAEDDRLAPHVQEADVAVPLRGSTTAGAYGERVAAILEAAAWQGADAIHPGHGFLAASATFAKAVHDAGLTWVGPSPDTARALGDHQELANQAAALGLGFPRAALLWGDDPAAWADAVRDLGYPVFVTAASSRGGPARHVARDDGELPGAVAAARRDARRWFTDGTILAEATVPGARLVEVTVAADGVGRVVALGEHEVLLHPGTRTLILDGPCEGLDDDTRARVAGAARELTAALGHRGIATVALLVRHGDLWLLDVDPTLPIGHPVAEARTGLDLVRVQLELAGGHPLDVAADVTPRGHALLAYVQARGTGTLHRWRVGATPGVRCDDGVATGTPVTGDVDPALAALSTHAPTRHEAAARLGRALRELQIHGVASDRDDLVEDLSEHVTGPASGDPATYEREWQRFNVLVGPHLAAAALADPTHRATRTPVWPSVPTGWRNVGGSVREMRPGETTWRITPTTSGFASQTVAFRRGEERWDVSYNRVQRDHPLALRRRADAVRTPSDLFNVTITGPSGHVTTIVEIIDLEDDDVVLVHFGRRGHRCTVHVVEDRVWVNSALGQTELQALPRATAP